MIVTYSMQNCLKSAASWNSGEDGENKSSINPKKTKLSESSEKEKKGEENEMEKRKQKLEQKKKKLAAMKELEKSIEGTSIYSIYYEGYSMVAVPLVEHENPTSVFVIIQTNFVPK